MPTIYKSGIDTWILVLLVGAVALSVVALGTAVLSESPAAWWTGVLAVGLGIGLPLWLLLTTHYALDSKELIVRCGPMKWRIPVSEITGISPTRSILSSPALSMDRLRIDYGSGRWLMISPRDKQQFLRQIDAERTRRKKHERNDGF